MYEILTGANGGPCVLCDEPCKGAIAAFERRNKKWQPGCINFRTKIAAYWGISTNRVSSIYDQLKTIARKYAGFKDDARIPGIGPKDIP